MGENKSCSALRAIEQEVKGEGGEGAASWMNAELQRERQRNAELMERISFLEAQLQERDKESLRSSRPESRFEAAENFVRSFKRNKKETSSPNTGGGDDKEQETSTQSMSLQKGKWENRLINWMSKDKDKDKTLILDLDKSGDSCSDAMDDRRESDESSKRSSETKENLYEEVLNQESCISRSFQIKDPEEIKTIKKMPFCPKEVKKILESDTLLMKNAQSHTMRKIIVFASLGIRHGCEDMLEFDFNHFSVFRKGEPYVSLQDPGEHVLYENPGIRRKIFYPNRENPLLCPVKILEEEKAMRPADSQGPSNLFLCIKYGGSTRNLPQNEYVRQRMGRNKLKSFGPLMCRMARLVHIRGGSFFFKALGITLLFMAGFPDDLVQMETKHRNLDLLQKYYRTDEKAEGEELFLSKQSACEIATSGRQELIHKPTSSKKSKGRKQTGKSKPRSPAAIPSTPSKTLTEPQNHANETQDTNAFYSNSTAYSIYWPIMYWPPPGAFPVGPYGYRSPPLHTNYLSLLHPRPYCNHPSKSPSTVAEIAEDNRKDEVAARGRRMIEVALDEADGSESGSS